MIIVLGEMSHVITRSIAINALFLYSLDFV